MNEYRDDDSITELFGNIDNLSLIDKETKVGQDGDDATFAAATTCTTNTTRSQQRKLKRQSRKKGKSKSQHSLEHLRQRVSHLMSLFEKNGWFIPLPDYDYSQNNHDQQQQSKNNKKGKVWSNRNYGADKKRQRKHSEKEMPEARIAQLENVLQHQHGVNDIYDDNE